MDAHSDAYVAGITTTSGFPTTSGAFDTSYPQAGSADTGLVAKLRLGTYGAPTGTTTTLTADANPQSLGTKVTFTALIQPAPGTAIPTGTVTFTVDSGASAPVAIDDTGHASYATSTLTAGNHTIAASYSGDADFTSINASLTETIVGSAANIAVVSGSGQTTPYGSAFPNPFVVFVKDANGNPVPGVMITFAGSGLSFSATNATTTSNGEASVTAVAIASGSLTASAGTTPAIGNAAFSLTATKVALTVTAANARIALALLLLPMRRRRIWPALALAIVTAAAMMIAACGGSAKTQSYTVTVTAAGGNVSQSASVTLTTKH